MVDRQHRFPVEWGLMAQDQRSLYEQLLALYDLANRNGLYDAADWVMNTGIKPVQGREEHVCTWPCEICASRNPNYFEEQRKLGNRV
jgi:hypothetical protein